MSILFQAHRGVSAEAPENTMAAVTAAAAQKYALVEVDPAFTSDGTLLLLHDETVNRTARLPNGKTLDRATPLCELSLSQAAQLDFGVWFSRKFKGEKIPELAKVLLFARENGIKIKIDNKWQKFPQNVKEKLFSLCNAYPETAQLTCNGIKAVKEALKEVPNAFIHYDGTVENAVLAELSLLLPKNRLAVWMPVKSPLTSWVKVDFITEEWARKIKQVALLGIWIIKTERELNTAGSLGADIVETPGQCKPEQNRGVIYDMHTHSLFSHDSNEDCLNSREKALQTGLTGIAVTDHCDIEFSDRVDVIAPIVKSCCRARQVGALTGIEIGEGIYFPETAFKAEHAYPYDVILGSVHAVRVKNYDMPYSGIDFSTLPKPFVENYLDTYWNDLKEMIVTGNFDVLSHLSCPLRYINGKYGYSLSLYHYEKKITEILQMIIERGIALEVNTSCMGSAYDQMMPEAFILKKYADMGGYLITLGSDAHSAERVGYGFEKTIEYLSGIGISNVYYYKNRIAVPCKLITKEV